MQSNKKRENVNPNSQANPISKLFMWWLRDLFWKGYFNDLGPEDMYGPCKEDRSEVVGDCLEREWLRQVIKARTPSLVWAIVHGFWRSFTVQAGMLVVLNLVLKLLQPLLLSRLVQFFSPDSSIQFSEALCSAGALLGVTTVIMMLTRHYVLHCFSSGMRLRIACCSLLYRKLLRLSLSAGPEMGHLVNLMSNDAARFDQGILFFHYLWFTPLQIPLIAYLLWQFVGVASLAGLAAVFLQSTPIQVVMTKMSHYLRTRTAVRTDRRIRIVSELLSGIELVKMYVWEQPYSRLIQIARKLELREVAKLQQLRGVYLSFMVFSERSSLFAMLVTYAFLENSLTADKVFATALYFNILNQTTAIYFPSGLAMWMEASVTIKRLQTFLLQDEVSRESAAPGEEDGGIVVNCVTGRWGADTVAVLKNVQLIAEPGELVAVVGTVGAGKSSLLSLLLRELPVVDAYTCVSGRISYMGQTPWLFESSVRQNILFGQLYQVERYQEVLHVCALVQDLEMLPHGDETRVGERGVTLSGGQRARISLARTVYREADIYLLDDPLSALDPQVAQHVFDACILDFLRGKTRVLVTHHLRLVKHASSVIVLNMGTVQAVGSYESVLTTHPKALMHEQMDSVRHDRDVEQGEEVSVNDEVEEKTEDDRGNPDRVSELLLEKEPSSRRGSLEQPAKQIVAEDMVEEGREVGTIKWKTYYRYFTAGGNLCSLTILVLLLILAQVFTSAADFWVSVWTNEQEEISANTTTSLKHSPFGIKSSISIYSCIIVVCIALTLIRSVLFFKICIRASRRLHDNMLQRVVRAPMFFFQTNPSGRILNRFTKDVGVVDELLPRAIIDAIQCLLQIVGVLCLIVVVNPWMSLPVIAVGVVSLLIRSIYLSTARDLKRLDSISCSTIFSHLNATLLGLTTIRASKMEDLVRREFDHLQDVNTSASYLVISTAVAFGLYLDLVGALFIGVVSFSFLLLGQAFGGSVGLAVSQSIFLTNFMQFGIRQTAEVVSQMTAVERLLEYCDIDSEPQTGNQPPKGWPSEGRIKFDNFLLRYSKNSPPVLQNLCLEIQPSEKVGIVGRTGAGKTSLIKALFRLAWDEGDLLIDGVNIRHLRLDYLRAGISIIPQEPMLFSGSLRDNLDPSHEYPDNRLWEALEQVELKETFSSLEVEVTGGGANLSVGQRQLVCLARAALGASMILVLDEPTASVDPRTDALIQKTLRRVFSACTILTVAHRLDTVLDSDRLLVMDRGCLVDSGPPDELINREGFLRETLLSSTAGVAGDNRQIYPTIPTRLPYHLMHSLR